MAWFRCFICGENFPGVLAGVPGLVGFYTTRFVEATDSGEAEALALELLRDEPCLALPPPDDHPAGNARVTFEKISELPASSVPTQQPGFVWHPMEADG